MENQNGSSQRWKELQVAKLAEVVRGQRAESGIPEGDWWDIWCLEDDAHCEAFMGTLEQFTEKLFTDGWFIVDATHHKVICPACGQQDDQALYAAQYQDGAGGLLQ